MAGGVARSQGWLSRPDTGGAAWACAGATPVRWERTVWFTTVFLQGRRHFFGNYGDR